MSTDSAAAPAPVSSSPSEQASDLFPLPLAPFERYFLCDDRVHYPMTFELVFEVEGSPDRANLEQAWADVLPRHPLLTARLESSRNWQAGDAVPQIDWKNASESETGSSEKQDVRKMSGLRLAVVAGDSAATLQFQFHHACCDAIGGLRFAGDLLARYDALCSSPDSPAPLTPVDAQLLRQRYWFDLKLPHPVAASTVLKTTLAEAWRIFSRWPVTIAGKRQSAPDSRLCLYRHLGDGLYASLQQTAKQTGVATNDVMLRDMFLTLKSWNKKHGALRERHWIRVNMPTSLRGERDVKMPATNLLGYALITRRGRDCVNPDELLNTLSAETRIIKDWGFGAVFVNAIGLLDRVPGLLPLMTGTCRQFTTLVYSNVGNPLLRFCAQLPLTQGRITAGNLTITSIAGAPPTRPGTRLAVMLMNYSGQLSIGLNADPRWFDEPLANEFLDDYVAALRKSCEHVTP